MTKSAPLERLPDVSKVTGAVLGTDEFVSLQYLSGSEHYEIRFPLEEILRAEDWFIAIREQVASEINKRDVR
jgi:hypothetical protein